MAVPIKEALDRFLSRFSFEDGVVLIQVPQVPVDLLVPEVARNRGYFAYPPQGLLYLSATFRKLGVPTRIVDLNFIVLREAQKEGNVETSWQKTVDQALGHFAHPFVGISFMFELNYPHFRTVCQYIRERQPEACIVAGGVNATSDPDRLLNQGLVDLVLSHEGERTLEAFYAYLRGQSENVPSNLSFLDSLRRVVRTSTATGGDVDLDIRQEYELIPIKQYHQVGCLSNYSRMNGLDVPFATVMSRRGCRGHCSFCGVRGFTGKGVRVRDNEGILSEMEYLYNQYGIRHFDWLDDDPLFDSKSAMDLFQKMAARLPDVSWAYNNGLVAASVTPELMRAMEKSGCIGFKVGLESGNESVLKKIRKPTTLKKFFKFTRISVHFPCIFVAVNFIIGFPGESFGQMLDSFKVALKAKQDWNNFYMYQPIKNTDLFLAYGGVAFDEDSVRYGKEAQGPNMNPVRGGVFRNYSFDGDLRSGYEIFDLEPEVLPSQDQLKEIWFTINYLVNFLHMPALFTESETRLRNGIRWMEVLSWAYPDDAAMACVLYYLNCRLSDKSTRVLKKLREAALSKFKNSEYWQFRDCQFKFSAFLDGVIPKVNPRYRRFVELELHE